MKSVARFFALSYGEEVDFDGAYVSTLVKPSQVLVHNFIGYDEGAVVGDVGLDPYEVAVREPDDAIAFTSRAGVSYAVVQDDALIDFLLFVQNSMPITQAFIRVNDTSDLATATEIDATPELAPNGGVFTYDIGAPNATRYFWIRLVDDAGNETIETLNSYSTQDNTPPTVDAFTLAAGASPTSEIDVGLAASDNDAVQSLYLLLSASQTTPPTATEIKAAGIALAGTATAHTVAGLKHGTTYFGWTLARDRVGNESDVVASTPPSLQTAPDVTPPSLDSFSLTPTVGSEESSVDITISISDVVA